MVVGIGLADYSVRKFHAQNRRLRLAAYYEIKRDVVLDLRIRRRMTQEKLAKTAGVSKQTITRMETGPNVPQFDTIEKVATALGTDAESLIVYHTPENERRIEEAQRDWEQRAKNGDESGEGDIDEGDDGTGNRGA